MSRGPSCKKEKPRSGAANCSGESQVCKDEIEGRVPLFSPVWQFQKLACSIAVTPDIQRVCGVRRQAEGRDDPIQGGFEKFR